MAFFHHRSLVALSVMGAHYPDRRRLHGLASSCRGDRARAPLPSPLGPVRQRVRRTRRPQDRSTQNSLPSGSASATNGAVSRWPTATCRAPSATRRSTSAATSPSVLRSGWLRFLSRLGCGVCCNHTLSAPGPASSGGTSEALPSPPASTRYPSARDQKAAFCL